MRLALATCKTLPSLDPDDQLLHLALKAFDKLHVDICVWDDPTIAWAQYDAVVIRSTWDYVPKRNEFVSWVKAVEQHTPVFNSAETIEWNSSKDYLRMLEAKGVPIVPTQWFSAGTALDFKTHLNQDNPFNEHCIVVKPVISASGKDTYLVTPDTLDTLIPSLEVLLQERDVMIQPYFDSVETQGELSFLFFNGQFSHAIQKIPQTGEFRVQEHFGGKNRSFTPTAEQLAFAQNVIQQTPWPTLYARVDAMQDTQGQLYLGELEITEPSMFLAYDPQAPQRFANAIQTCLLGRPYGVK